MPALETGRRRRATAWLIVHRWVGLSLALVLVLVGLTGAILPFASELNRLAAPSLWRAAPPSPGARVLDGIDLMERVERRTGGNVGYVRLSLPPDQAQAVFIEPREGGPALDCSEVIVDPYTGAVRRCLRYGDLSEGAVNIVPFLVRLHYSLAAGSWGMFAFGVAALIWCVECLLGLWLTLPRPVAGVRWAKRWLPAWRIRRGQGAVTLVHDLHRAVGLWLLPVMLVFAWSAVAFNLQSVHAPVQRLFGAHGLYAPVVNDRPAGGPAMSRMAALEHGETLMAGMAAQRGFTVAEPYAISWNPYAHAIGYYARTSLDGPTDQGSTAVWFDENSGRLLAFRHPFGDTPADAFDKATRMLHTASLFGWPCKLFVTFVGLAIAGMAMAGVALWFLRTRGRGLGRQESMS